MALFSLAACFCRLLGLAPRQPKAKVTGRAARRNGLVVMPQSCDDIGAMGLRLAIVALIGLSCGAAIADEVPRPRPPVGIEPRTFLEAAGAGFDTAAVTAEPSDCDRRLALIAGVTPMPRLIGPGVCGGSDMIKLNLVLLAGGASVDIRPAPVLRCAMAERLAIWLREDVSPRLAALGSAWRAVENFDAFECRGRNRVAGAKLSEHGKGNAIDIRAFRLADGRVIGLTDTAVANDLREGLRESACRRFTTVLGPGSDGQHEAHIHLDIAERRNDYRICQWDVRVPSPGAVRVPLPQPRPAELAGLSAQKP
jgi:hypothetical protein